MQTSNEEREKIMEEQHIEKNENTPAKEDRVMIPLFGSLFAIGEEVSLKGYKFRVTKVTPKKLTLRLISRGL